MDDLPLVIQGLEKISLLEDLDLEETFQLDNVAVQGVDLAAMLFSFERALLAHALDGVSCLAELSLQLLFRDGRKAFRSRWEHLDPVLQLLVFVLGLLDCLLQRPLVVLQLAVMHASRNGETHKDMGARPLQRSQRVERMLDSLTSDEP